MVLGTDSHLEARFAQARFYAPDHLPLEAANAIRKYVRSGVFDRAAASRALRNVLALQIQLVSAAAAAPAALSVALDRGLSVYDAAYVVVAEAMKVPLLTADRRLAEAYERSVLIS